MLVHPRPPPPTARATQAGGAQAGCREGRSGSCSGRREGWPRALGRGAPAAVHAAVASTKARPWYEASTYLSSYDEWYTCSLPSLLINFLSILSFCAKTPFCESNVSTTTERADSDTHHIMTIIRKLLVRHARPRVNHGCTSRIHGSKSSKYSTDHAHRPTAAPGRAACSTLTAPAREALRLNSLHALSHIMFGFRQQGYCSCSRTRCRLSSKLPSVKPVVHRINHDACALGAADSEALPTWLLMGGWKVIGRVLAAGISRSSPRTASTAKANS
jgi:hypothetical protein